MQDLNDFKDFNYVYEYLIKILSRLKDYQDFEGFISRS